MFNFFIMKKDYVNLNVQVVDVQLSDCIAGSMTIDDAKPFNIEAGTTLNQEIDGTVPNSSFTETW